MKKQKIKNEEGAYLISSNDCDDKNCPVCVLMKKCEQEGREPSFEEIKEAMLQAGGTVLR